MNQCVVGVRDSAMGAFNRPFVAPSLGVAIRSFTAEVNRVDVANTLNTNPGDFELWHLAEWDDVTGKFLDVEVRSVCRARDVLAPV